LVLRERERCVENKLCVNVYVSMKTQKNVHAVRSLLVREEQAHLHGHKQLCEFGTSTVFSIFVIICHLNQMNTRYYIHMIGGE
jgi:hypothetical protein